MHQATRMPSPAKRNPEANSTTTTTNMSVATKDVLSRVRNMVPPMLDRFHKGQLGRIGVVGGSEDYTGAPFFSAMASATLGCDMSHVICTPAAGAVIKTYSPNLMVHPMMRTSPGSTAASLTGSSADTDPSQIAGAIATSLLPRLHVLVVGPGLGRDPLMQDTCARVVRAARERRMPVVLDADALQLVHQDPALVKGYALAVLTPNVGEFGRLAKMLGVDGGEGEGGSGSDEEKRAMSGQGRGGGGSGGGEKETARVEAVARALGGVTVVQKGERDHISDGRTTRTVDVQGGRKRSAGQGDTLTGCIATFLGWRKAYLDALWDHGSPLAEEALVGLAAFGGSAITRECSRLAFIKKGRSLQASDLTGEVHNAFINFFGDVDEDTDADDGAKL